MALAVLLCGWSDRSRALWGPAYQLWGLSPFVVLETLDKLNPRFAAHCFCARLWLWNQPFFFLSSSQYRQQEKLHKGTKDDGKKKQLLSPSGGKFCNREAAQLELTLVHSVMVPTTKQGCPMPNMTIHTHKHTHNSPQTVLYSLCCLSSVNTAPPARFSPHCTNKWKLKN